MPKTDVTREINIADSKNLPETGELPAHMGKFNNLAGDEELTKKLRTWMASNLDYYKGQPERTAFLETGGTADVADRMYRVALRRDESSAQHEDTLSNVASTMYFRQVRAISSSLNAIFVTPDGLPAEYLPEVNTTEFTAADGQDIATQQNMLALHTQDEDDRIAKYKKINLFLCKYGNLMVSDEWDYIRDEKTERVPTKFNDEGRPISFAFKTKQRIIKDSPSLIIHDIKDCFFNAQINDMNKQRCLIVQGKEG